MENICSSENTTQGKHRLLPLLIISLLVISSTTFGGIILEPNDEVKLTHDAQLLFLDKPFRRAAAGESFKVVAYRPDLKMVFLSAKDNSGREIAVSVSEDSVAIVPVDVEKLRTDAVLAAKTGKYLDAERLIRAAMRAQPDNAALASNGRAVQAISGAAVERDRAAANQRIATDDAKRLRHNADVTDHPNPLDHTDHSGHDRGERLRGDARQLEERANENLVKAQASFKTAFATLDSLPSALPTAVQKPALAGVESDGRLTRARAYLLMALRETGNVTDAATKNMDLMDIAVAQTHAGQGTEALRIIASINEDDRSGMMAVVIGALAKFGETELALRNVSDLPDGEKEPALVEIVRGRARAEDITGALEIAGRLKTPYFKDEAFQEIASAQARAGDVVAALRTAAGISDEHSASFALHDVATAQAKAGDLSGAFHTATRIKESSWKAHAVGEVVAAAVTAQNLTAARLIIDDINDPNARSVAQALGATAQAKTGDIQGAVESAKNIWNTSWRNIALRDIAAKQAEAGDIAGALVTVEWISKGSGQGELDSALGSIAVEQAKAGNLHAALVIVDRSTDDLYMRPSAVGRIAALEAMRGNDSSAQKTVELLAKGPKRVAGYVQLAEALIDGRQSRARD